MFNHYREGGVSTPSESRKKLAAAIARNREMAEPVVDRFPARLAKFTEWVMRQDLTDDEKAEIILAYR